MAVRLPPRPTVERIKAILRKDSRRTAIVLQLLAEQGIEDVTSEQVRQVAANEGIELERGPAPGQGRAGPGRPRGVKETKRRAERSDRGQRRVEVSPERAAAAYEEAGSLRKAAALLGISHETVSQLLSEHRQKLSSDAK